MINMLTDVPNVLYVESSWKDEERTYSVELMVQMTDLYRILE